MLVLSRHRDESIVIDLSRLTAAELAQLQAEGKAKVEVCVVDIRGDKVRLGASASPVIPVHRSEVFDAILRNGSRKAS